ncbi:unnamed protein product [Ilex paraguariensis]|uniref:Uncharacterized protein n=1 Tax=Ilex paraguariensis TaxID=185542 RepID=A0ABC8RWW1_9AQUA
MDVQKVFHMNEGAGESSYAQNSSLQRGLNHVDKGNAFFWGLLSQSFFILVSPVGEIEREKLDSYEVHIYAPSKDELQDEVRRQGSFEMNRLELFEIESDSEHGSTYGMTVAMTGRLVDEEMAIEEIKPITFVVVLRKL